MERPISAQGVRTRLESEHARHRATVLQATAWIALSFAVAAIALGGDVVTTRVEIPLIAIGLAALLTLFLARIGRTSAGMVLLTVVAVGVATDAHVVHRLTDMAPAYAAVFVSLGIMVLPRRAAFVQTGALLVAVTGMVIGRWWAGDGSEPWFPSSLDLVTLVTGVGILGLVQGSRVDRDRRLLYDAVDSLERQRGEVETSRNEAQASAAAARMASDLKSQFLARASHELRTPLNAILGYAELLQEGDDELGEETRADVERIRIAACHQLRLVDDLLDLARIESGRMALRVEAIDLPALVAPVVDATRALARAKGLATVERIDPDCVTVDSGRVRQVLLNLVSNAVRFTERGEVSISAMATSGGLTLVVADTGIGIRAERLGHLFQPFAQAEPDTAYRYGGTGLGLVITDRLVRAMGGTLAIETRVGSGTVVRVELPQLDPATLSTPDAEPVPARP